MTASSSTPWPTLRSASRPDCTCNSATRTLLAVLMPLNSVCVTVTPMHPRSIRVAAAARLDGVGRQQIAHRLQSAAQARDDLRPIARQRLRHVLVGGALPRPFGIELRIGLVGLGGASESSRRKSDERPRGPPRRA